MQMSTPSSLTMPQRRPLLQTAHNASHLSSRKPTHTSASATSSAADTTAVLPTRKRHRSPCADEKHYRDLLLPRFDSLEAEQAKLRTGLDELHQTILSFYLANMIEVEPSSGRSSSREDGTDDAPASIVQSRIPYYQTSAIAKARAVRAALCEERKTERERLEKKIAEMEAEVERTIVRGSLAEQRAVTEAEEQALAHREKALRQCQATIAALENDIAKEKDKLPAMASDMKACDARIRLLEERKRKQMDNVEQTRQELLQQRQRTAEAEAECQRRQNNVKDLESEIERRLRLLKRAKRRD